MTEDIPPIKHTSLDYQIGTTVQRMKLTGVSTLTVLGEDTRTGEKISVDDVSRCRGCYIIGTHGTGKSSLLENMIYQDIEKNYAVIVLDPHGQLIENIVSRMSAAHLKRAYFLDLTDEAYPFGFNIFSCRDLAVNRERNITRDRVMSIFDKVWPSDTRTILLPMLLKMVADTLIEHADTMTMADIPALLLDADYRDEKVKTLRKKSVRDYWQQEYNTNSQSVQRRETAPLRNRLHDLLGNSIITNVICQKKASIDFRAAIENREILLIKMPVEEEGYTTAAEIIGTIMLAQIYATTFSFADTPEAKRPGYSLYIDEFKYFATKETAELFTGGRKYKVRQTLAHQTRVQLNLPTVEDATMSANTIISLALIPKDSRELAEVFTDIDLYPEIEHIDRAFMSKLRSHKNEAVKTLWARYVRQWEQADNKEPKRRREDGYTYSEWPKWNLGYGIVEYHPNQVRAALNILDELLYHAMRHKEHDSDLEQSLLHLFANWYGQEQQELFTKHIDAAVDALIEEPIGERRETDKAEIADYIFHLEERHALATINKKTYEIKTLPLPQSVSRKEIDSRIAKIRELTRNKYCRSREEVEAELGTSDTFDADEQTPDSITLQTLARSHPDLALVQIRKDIEEHIKALYAQSVPQKTSKSVRRSLNEMVQSLRNQDILDNSLTSTLMEIISLANVAAHPGATIKTEQVLPLIYTSRDAIDALTHLLQPDEDTSQWKRFEEIKESE